MSTDKPKSWVKILLVASLALNLLIIGLVAGAMFKKDRWRGSAPRAELGMGPLTHALDPSDRRALGQKFRKQGKQSNDRRVRKKQFEELLSVLKADPFDAVKAAELLGSIRTGSQARMETAQGLLVEHLSSMSAQDRAAYADRLETRLKQRKKKPKK